jgi:hypothetical protein
VDDTTVERKSSLNRSSCVSKRETPPPQAGSILEKPERCGALNASPLTNYKNVVDIQKKYGVSKSDLLSVKLKIKQQENFLKFSYIRNKLTGQTFSLSECMISSNHNPHRYYAEIQTRIDALTKEAEKANLTPVFLTLTLPSEFHCMKQILEYNKVQRKMIPIGELIKNPKYNGTTPKDAIKILTKMFGKLRQDRSLKELSKAQRMYYRVNEPQQDGTPHTHILLFIPKERIERAEKAFNRLFNSVGNKFEKEIRSPKSYIMKYINKTLPRSKEKMSQDDEYLNAWYIKNRVNRFCSSRSTAPIYLYRLVNHKYTLFALTQIRKRGQLQVLADMNTDKIMEIWDDGEPLYIRNENIEVNTVRGLVA